MTQTKKSPKATALVASYFDQGKQYYSTSKEAMLTIAEMAPAHAANAAEALLREARAWAADAGVTERPGSWMAGTVLFQALRARATVNDDAGVQALADIYAACFKAVRMGIL